ncbi:MAG: hypothetical protein M3N24_06445 [Actinomycetota bacterium]|nr:hypothetical protein [Actinomycetota bacterium]
MSLVTLTLLAAAPSAEGQQAPGRPSVSGSVVGELRRGDRITFTVRVVEPRGYRELAEIRIAMLLQGLVLSELTFVEDANSIGIRGGSLLQIGAPGTIAGSFFRYNGLEVRTEASGRTLTLTVPAVVMANVPPGANFRFTAVNDSGATGVVVRHLNIEEAGVGFGWGTVLLAVLLALFAGAFVGNLFATRRATAPSVSVYGAIQRRLNEEQPTARR